MPLPAHAFERTDYVRAMGSLALSCLAPLDASLVHRAVLWSDRLSKIGVEVPWYFVHDVGGLLAWPKGAFEMGPRVDIEAVLLSRGMSAEAPLYAEAHKAHVELMRELSTTELILRAEELDLSDELVVAILAKLCAGGSTPPGPRWCPSFDAIDPLPNGHELGLLFLTVDRSAELSFATQIAKRALWILTTMDSFDLDTMRLFGMLGTGLDAMGSVHLYDLLDSTDVSDIVNFSLEILPSVLESAARPSASRHSAFGISGLGRQGSIDSLVLSELAWSNEEIAKKMLDGELLYYLRESEPERDPEEHIILIDASASMRGDRQTFARAVGLATYERLVLQREKVQVRFFDSRLYDPLRAPPGKVPTAEILSFRGERGRNPSRVFRELGGEVEELRRRGQRRPVVHIFTHGSLYVPRELVAQIRRSASIYAVFMLPSGGALSLDYVDLLTGHFTLDHSTISERSARANAAKSIVLAGPGGRAAKGTPPRAEAR